MTFTSVRIHDLTCCRAIFACWVFIYHLNLQLFQAIPFGPLTPLIKRGYLGVDGFFILSGLVLAHAHPRLGLSKREFYNFCVQRLARIYPVHIAVIVILAVLLAAAMALGVAPRDPGRFGADELIRNLLLIHGWGMSDRWAWNYPSWSISTEWAGYLAFPILWWALRRLNARMAAALLGLMLLLLAWVEARGGGMRLNLAYLPGLPRFALEFTAGALLARCAAVLAARRGASWLALLGGAGAVLAAFGPYDTLVVACLTALLAGLFARGLQGRGAVLAAVPGFVFLGTISYSFYMSFAVVEMMQAVLWRRLAAVPADHVAIFSLSTMAATLGMAVLLWRWVERPGQRVLHLAVRPSHG